MLPIHEPYSRFAPRIMILCVRSARKVDTDRSVLRCVLHSFKQTLLKSRPPWLQTQSTKATRTSIKNPNRRRAGPKRYFVLRGKESCFHLQGTYCEENINLTKENPIQDNLGKDYCTAWEQWCCEGEIPLQPACNFYRKANESNDVSF